MNVNTVVVLRRNITLLKCFMCDLSICCIWNINFRLTEIQRQLIYDCLIS